MDSSADNDRRNPTRKKYVLSMKNRLQNYTNNIARSKKNLLDNEASLRKNLTSDISEFEESQNFSLRLSDSFVDDNTNGSLRHKKIEGRSSDEKEAEVIVISDSSDDDRADIIRPTRNEVATPNAKFAGFSESSMTFSSIDMSEIWTDEEKTNTVPKNKSSYINFKKNDLQKDSVATSQDKNRINHNYMSESKNNVYNIDALTLKNRPTPLEHGGIRQNTQVKPYHTGGETIHKNISNSDHFVNVNERQSRLCNTPNSAGSAIRTTPLTMKDARDIARVIRSKQAVYNSPGQWQRKNDIVDSNSEGSQDSNASEEIDNGKKKMNHPVWIKETDSESSDASSDSGQVSTKLIKTHVSRFLNPTVTDCNSAQLSEHKKEEISRWLLSNPIDSRSDSSMSCVPLSEQNSMSSGNSSLERLELNFETPNNRNRFQSKTYIQNNKSKTVPTPTSQVQSVEERQTTIDSFLKKVKCGDKDISYFTPTPITKTKKSVRAALSPEDITDIQIGDCADILDELYGDVWRKQAGDLLPGSEPRRPNPKVQDRAVQTERKKIIRSKQKASSIPVPDNNSNNDDFNTLTNKTKSDLNSIKKSKNENKKWRNSFINDNVSSSCSDGETTYLTALTTPRVSNSQNRMNNDTPMSALTMRAIEICDSDTEDDDYTISPRKIDENKRRLSYSDDEIDLRSSPGTSEYDPDDIIPPKSVIKQKNASASKFTSKISSSTRIGVSKSFLASLSPSVPLVNAHPDAKKYRTSYKTTKDELCKYLYKLYNDKIFCNKLPLDMLIEWNVRMRGTAGSCYNKTKKNALGTVERSSRIVLATKILDAPDRLRDTLVHEMCHAATWLINEVSDGHGPFWQAWASRAMKAFPELPSIKRCHDYKIATKYTYRCVRCGYSVGRHSKSLDVERKRCGHCYGKFELLINKTTKSGTVQVKTPSNKKATGFALFVKENYHLVKKERRDVGHKELMQILGQQFAAVKISKDNNVDC